jgi:hypothetical protein
LDDQVNVIGHEAVRKNRERAVGCGAQNVRQAERNRLALGEHGPPLIDGKNERIPVFTLVCKVLSAT